MRHFSPATGILLAVLIPLMGCVPEESTHWSADGRQGVLWVDGKLYFHDEISGQTIRLTENEVTGYPTISADGKWLAWGEAEKFADLERAEKALTPAEARQLRADADKARGQIQKAGNLDKAAKQLQEELPDQELPWIARILARDNPELFQPEPNVLRDIGKAEVAIHRLQVAAADQPERPTTVGRSIFHQSVNPKFSPDNRYLAFQTSGKDEVYQLHVLDRETHAIIKIADLTALGYSWRRDSRALAYLRAVDMEKVIHDFALGHLVETQVANEQKSLLTKPLEGNAKPNRIDTREFAGESRNLAEILFHPACQAEYLEGNNLLFQSGMATLPRNMGKERIIAGLFRLAPGGSITKVDDVSDENLLIRLSPDKQLLLYSEEGQFRLLNLADNSRRFIEGPRAAVDPNRYELVNCNWKGNEQLVGIYKLKDQPKPEPNQPRAPSLPTRKVLVFNRDGKVIGDLVPDLPSSY